jgi:hypothetical protein
MEQQSFPTRNPLLKLIIILPLLALACNLPAVARMQSSPVPEPSLAPVEPSQTPAEPTAIPPTELTESASGQTGDLGEQLSFLPGATAALSASSGSGAGGGSGSGSGGNSGSGAGGSPSAPGDLGAQVGYGSGGGTTDPTITHFWFCDAPCDGSYGNEMFLFPEGIQKIYVYWEHLNFTPGMRYTREWFYEGSQSWIRYDCTWQGGNTGWFSTTLKEPGGLRSGTWTVVMTIEGKYRFEATLEVAGSFNYWSPAGTQPCKDF